MVLKYKKFFLLGFATLFGIGIILFAWKGGSVMGGEISSEPSATKSVKDENIWKDSLKVIPQNSFSRLFGANSGNKDIAQEGYASTTVTALLGQELLTSYALVQKSTGKPLTDTETQGIAGIIADKAMINDTKQYTEKDIIIVPSSETASAVYIQEIFQALNLLARKYTVKDLAVVKEAMDSGDASKLAPLSISVTNLKQLIKTLLSIKTPKEAVKLHLYLVQSYATILSGVIDMQQIIADPALGMRGITKYKNGMDALATLNEIILRAK